ncbi:MAG: metal ABC transporter solute-binding protein, Zn/Mn family [Lachnospiraceae bacterium]
MRKNWKKLTAFAAVTGSAVVLSACGTKAPEDAADVVKTEQSGESSTGQQNASIVCTSYPQYDFVNQILGDNPAGIEVTYLLGSGVDMHNYQASADDMIKIRTSDLFLYIGGESDQWAEDVAGQIEDEKFHAIALLDTIEAKREEIVEGMQHDHDHEHSHGPSEFADSEVADRSLSDWEGQWQSVYPYLLDGSLAEVMEHKAEDDDEKTAQEYYDYYNAGYQTDVEKIVIDGSSMEFFRNGESAKTEYEYKGFEILTYESGSKGVRYQFEATGETDGAPKYVQFSDHMIGPEKVEHYHIYFGDDGFDALLAEMDNWPTYYPEGMTGEAIADDMTGQDHSHDEDEDDEDEAEFDEHVWLSLKNAMVITDAICGQISELDPEHTDLYQSNLAAYNAKLAELDAQYEQMVKNSSRDAIMIADRFPFRYLVDDYGLTYYAAFPGCSAETEASFDTIVFLSEKLNELQFPVIFDIDGSDGSIAKTVINNSSQQGTEVRTLNSLQSVSRADIEAGASYLNYMEENLNQLKGALN